MEFPKGSIIMWHDKNSTRRVPEGWAICDGKNGTPNLIDRLPIGTAEINQSGEQIGSSSHRHKVAGDTGDLRNGRGVGGSIDAPSVQVMGDERHAHNHRIELDTTEITWLPPSTKVIFIIKL